MSNTATTRAKIVNQIKRQTIGPSDHISDNIKNVRKNRQLLGIKGVISNEVLDTHIYIDTTAETGHAPAKLNSIDDLLGNDQRYLWRKVASPDNISILSGTDNYTATLQELIDEVAAALSTP